MMSTGQLLFVAYPRCTTCRRARSWLDAHGVGYASRHIVEDRPTVAEIAAWHAKSGLPVRRLFNTSGMAYRELGVKSMLDAGMSDEGCYALLATNGMLVRRPVLVGDDFALFGFREGEWAERFATGADHTA